MDLSVVVLSWNTAGLTLRALGAAGEGAARLEHEVVCVDNASSDDTVARVRAALPHVRVIQNEANLGFAAGNNRAIPSLRGRHVCFLNSDAAPGRGSLTHLSRHLDAHPDVGIVAPRLVGPDGRTQRAAREETSTLGLLHRFTVLRFTPFGRRASRTWTRGVTSEVPVAVASVTGACLVIRRDLLDALGGFDPGYPFYFEDVDLCRRARALGPRVVYVPDGPPVRHQGGAATARRRGGPPRRALIQGLLRYLRKDAGEVGGQALALALVVGVLARALLEPPGLLLRAGGRHLRGRREDARRTLGTAASWMRFLERDAGALIRLLARPRLGPDRRPR